MGSSRLSGFSLSTHNTGLPLMAPRVLSVCLILLICARVCVCVFMVELVEVFIVWLL